MSGRAVTFKKENKRYKLTAQDSSLYRRAFSAFQEAQYDEAQYLIKKIREKRARDFLSKRARALKRGFGPGTRYRQLKMILAFETRPISNGPSTPLFEELDELEKQHAKLVFSKR